MKYITSVLSLKKNCVEKLTIKKLLVPARISVIHLFTRAGYLATGYPASGFSQGPYIRRLTQTPVYASDNVLRSHFPAPTCIPGMVNMLDGRSDCDAHVWSEL